MKWLADHPRTTVFLMAAFGLVLITVLFGPDRAWQAVEAVWSSQQEATE